MNDSYVTSREQLRKAVGQPLFVIQCIHNTSSNGPSVAYWVATDRYFSVF